MTKYLNKRQQLLRDEGAGVAKAYSSWVEMRKRVKHPQGNPRNGLTYVGKTIDSSWGNFETFLDDMGECPPRHSLDRIDGSKGYSPDNCRWADSITQSRNRGCIKLSENKVLKIKDLRSKGWSQQNIADKMGCSQRLISMVLLGQVWRQF